MVRVLMVGCDVRFLFSASRTALATVGELAKKRQRRLLRGVDVTDHRAGPRRTEHPRTLKGVSGYPVYRSFALLVDSTAPSGA